MIKYLEKNFDEEIANKKVLVDFFAEWCGPCRMQSEVLKEFTDIDVIKVDVDKFSEIAKQYGIMSIPTLILFENGKVIKTHTGFMNISLLQEFIKWIKTMATLFFLYQKKD